MLPDAFRSIRPKLSLSFGLVAAVSALVVGTACFFFVKSYVDRRETSFLSQIAQSVSQQVRPLLGRADGLQLQRIADAIGFVSDVRVRILDPQLRVIADSHPAGNYQQPDLSVISQEYRDIISRAQASAGTRMSSMPRGRFGDRERPGLHPLGPIVSATADAQRTAGQGTVVRTSSESPGASFSSAREVRQEVTAPGGPIGYVEVSSPAGVLDETVQRARTALVLSGLGAVALAVLFGLIMGRKISSPITRLNDAVTAMAGGDLTIRAAEDRKDEIGKLAQQFNTMAVTLEQSFRNLETERDALRQFTADASHELRTPVTALRTFNELLSGEAGAVNSTREEFLADSHRQIERLEWVVESLLTFARLDAGSAALDMRKTSVATLIDGAFSPFSQQVKAKGVRLDVTYEELRDGILCDVKRLTVAISNVMDNAVKFSPAGSQITIRGRRAEKDYVISIRDQGPGIAEHELPLVFRRFYRSPSNRMEGSGIGLALSASIIEAHGGSIAAESPEGGGALLRITLPASS